MKHLLCSIHSGERLRAFCSGERLRAFTSGERLRAFCSGERLRTFGITICLLLVVLSGCSSGSKNAVYSPNGERRVEFRLTDAGVPQYRYVSGEGSEKMLLDWSNLGMETEQTSLCSGFSFISTCERSEAFSTTERSEAFSTTSRDTTWETVWGEERFIRDHHNEMTVSLRHSSGALMNIVFRIFDDGMAFRYVFPEQECKDIVIIDELTEYRFAADHEAWSIPWRTEYYEGLWTKAPLSEKYDTLCSPLTLKLSDDGYAFLHEAALTDYPAENFYIKDGAVRLYLTPWLDLNGVETPFKAYLKTPFQTPWRMLILTRTLPELVASRIMLNLNEPCAIADTEWIRPTKFMGIWWGMHMKSMTWEQGPKHGATTENMERYMRFAKEHGINAVLAEGWNKGWEDWKNFEFTTPYDDWDMDYLSRLSDSLGVQIIGHNETGGNAASYERDLDSIYRYHAANGIHVIKTGYVAPIIRTMDGLQWNKGQSGVRHYRKVIETAAKYHIAIDNHEPVMPTGLQRTYPNLMSQEGVRGQEWNAWSADGGSPCEHVTVLPFTRIMAGPVDYTPGVFAFENPVMPNTRVHSTLMNQLGLFVCFYSPLQMACDLPENYMKHPNAFAFIEQVPCNWERSILVDGEIGEYCIFARQERGGDNWYIGGINADAPREAVIPLSMLEEGKTYHASIWRDGEEADWQTNPYDYEIDNAYVATGDTLRIRMASGGGFAVSLTQIN